MGEVIVETIDVVIGMGISGGNREAWEIGEGWSRRVGSQGWRFLEHRRTGDGVEVLVMADERA